MQHEGAEPADPGDDHGAVFRVRADIARQAQKAQALVQIHIRCRPSLGQGGALWFALFAQLHIGAEATGFQENGQAGLRIDAQFTVTVVGGCLAVGLGDLAGKAAFGIVRATDEGPEFSGFQRQLAGAAGRATARVSAVRTSWEDVRP